jgi:DNA-binding transcriptional regulator YdaS (Cro superfamily)
MQSTRALIRRRSGLSQVRLAKLVGTHSPIISLWENGDIRLATELVEKIGRAIAAELARIQVRPTAEDVVRALTTDGE